MMGFDHPLQRPEKRQGMLEFLILPMMLSLGLVPVGFMMFVERKSLFGTSRRIVSPEVKAAIEPAQSQVTRTNQQLVTITNLVHSREVSRLPEQVRNIMSHVLAKLVKLTASDAKKLDFDKQHVVDTVLFEHFPDTLALYMELPEKERTEQATNVSNQFIKLYNALVVVEKSVITDATRKLETNKLYLEQKFGRDDTSQLSLTSGESTQSLLETSAATKEPPRTTLSFAEKLQMAAMEAEALNKKIFHDPLKPQQKRYHDVYGDAEYDYEDRYPYMERLDSHCDEHYGYKNYSKNYDTIHENYNRVPSVLAMEAEAKRVHGAALRAEARTRALLKGKNEWKY
jgi:hypothetical protein